MKKVVIETDNLDSAVEANALAVSDSILNFRYKDKGFFEELCYQIVFWHLSSLLDGYLEGYPDEGYYDDFLKLYYNEDGGETDYTIKQSLPGCEDGTECNSRLTLFPLNYMAIHGYFISILPIRGLEPELIDIPLKLFDSNIAPDFYIPVHIQHIDGPDTLASRGYQNNYFVEIQGFLDRSSISQSRQVAKMDHQYAISAELCRPLEELIPMLIQTKESKLKEENLILPAGPVEVEKLFSRMKAGFPQDINELSKEVYIAIAGSEAYSKTFLDLQMSADQEKSKKPTLQKTYKGK